MKKIIFTSFIFFFFSIYFSMAQMQDKLWLMGYGCCSPNFTGIDWDFRSGVMSISSVQRHFNFAETNGQICDATGNFLFASNGIYVSNSLDDTMLNGDGLNPSSYTSSHSTYGLHIPQANIVIPMPGDSMKYYLFHETSDDQFATYATYYLYYSIIDMSLDGGLGGVVQKNMVLLNDSLVEGLLTSCKHANGRDWWLIAHKFRSTISFRYLITPYGIQGPWLDNLITWRNNYFGQTVFSKDGSKYVYYEPYGDLDIWDFDRCDGTFSNQIHIDINDSSGAGGAAFSQNGRYLYISSGYYVYQFDLQSSNIPASKTTIAVYDGFASGGSPTFFYLEQLGPDNKIYINSTSTVFDFHVINFPDSAGLACDLQQHSVHLPGFSASLPNHPNYFLGPIPGSVCDSLASDIPIISSAVQSFYVFPNPARDVFYITHKKSERIKLLRVINSLGQEQKTDYSSISNGEYLEINIFNLSSGIYFLEMLTEKQRIVKKFVKE